MADKVKYQITRKEWERIKREHPDYTGTTIQRYEYEGRVCEAGEACCFEYLLPGAPHTGCTLVFEHIHFEIV